MEKLAQVFKALGDDTRLEIVNMLVGKELCVCDIMDAFSISQPAISHHLKVLKQADVLVDERVGKWIYYSLNSETLQCVESYLGHVKNGNMEKSRCMPCSANKL